MSNRSPKTTADAARPSTTTERRTTRWRVVDIITAAVVGVACGLIFVAWNTVGYAWFLAADAVTPGLGGTATGIWLLGGVLGGLIIRKPGAALFVEVLAAVVSMLLGSQWSIETVYSGLAQGIGAELVFAAFAYRRFGLPVAVLAGAGSGLAAIVLELFLSANIAKGLGFNLVYASCTIVSGAVLAGVVGWLLVRALARTGALSRFAAGRDSARV
ncbi:hypothetical protein F8O01_09545 [Pseudoclavibacter chungangensis]|uniref:Uncharacterized protein n=1 Tax=Pseudoclavibacter chungangensis TaxID=587635 RepID=A0A7J5BTK9_9MICO|nr:ECF transporter S component [Pseudoclavibacter chungangensis]KAB1656877.1 hypothetical protein F8O01_09545 [Pseudoclavibacter chungangensis]NYJ67344.1 energy-coupling factor transport system substrate-specific component [Pseudoclavibacter chungangensis]